MVGRGTRYLAAAFAVGLGLLPTPTPAPALRTYEPTGTPVKGTPEQRGAPVLKPGLHLDRIDVGQTRYYAIDVPADHTARFSAAAIVAGNNSLGEKIDLDLYAPDGARCPGSRLLGGKLGEPVFTGVLSWQPRAESTHPCDRPGPFAVRVQRDDASPVIRGPIALELLITMEPPAIDPGPESARHPVAFTEPADPPTEVVGGGSFATAGTLNGSGRYTDTLRPGEFVFYRIRLTWGQGLAHRVLFPEGARIRSGTLHVVTHQYGPDRRQINSSPGFYRGAAIRLPGDRPALATLPIRHLNRMMPIPQGSVAGWYYIVVKYGNRPATDVALPSLRIQLDVAVVGRPEPGPVYATGTATAPPGESARAAGSVTRPGNTRGGPWRTIADATPLVWVAGAAILILLILLFVIFLRCRLKSANVILSTSPGPPRQGRPTV